ncbi:MAG: SDR family oxidoreductase [Gracilibacteraceae bacterium]|jgi:nucleoside-diphosphate-sugar epimerase|nr:SDR family oxidoreductase [Gracilibacteraceae bacterium]
MRVFITGGTGFIGAAVIRELLGAGHEIIGLARSEKAREALTAMGAAALDGSLEDLGSLRRGAEAGEAVIHLAFIHNFADFAASAQTDKLAIEAIGEALIGTSKPFIVTSGVPSGENGRVITENDGSDPRFPRLSEQATLPLAGRGVQVLIVRPSRFVHGDGVYGFITQLMNIAREKGAAAYIGDGANRIHAVHRLDLARLYLLALEKGVAGAKYQGVGDFAVPYRDVAAAIGKRLDLPVVSIPADAAAEHFGFLLGQVAGADNPASSEITQAALGWRAEGPSLLEDLGSITRP